MPNLGKLFADAEGQTLLQWTLRLVQGHSKLLEFADGVAADREMLKAQLLNAESAAEGGAGLQAFFDTGDSTREEAQFIEAFSFWTRSLEERLSPSARLLFQFLACVEEEDRYLPILSMTWPVFLENARTDLPGLAEARTDAELYLTVCLRELTGPGLIEERTIPASYDTLTDTPLPVRYALHPAVAETSRGEVAPALRTAVDQTVADLWMHHYQHYIKHETDGNTANLVVASKHALPYLERQKQWKATARILSEVVNRDQSSATLTWALPRLEQAVEVGIVLDDNGSAEVTLARTLGMLDRNDEAQERLQLLMERGLVRNDYRLASVAASNITNLFIETGRYEEALALLEREVEYVRRAGLGPWTQLRKEVKRLQIGNAMGQYQTALMEREALFERMETLSKTDASGQQESVRPFDVREFLLSTLREAALHMGQDALALELNLQMIQSLRTRSAGNLEIAGAIFNNYGPLFNMGCYPEARELLQVCLEVFIDAGKDDRIGQVYGALAELESILNHTEEAISFGKHALLHLYVAKKPDDCAIGHCNLAPCYERLNQLSEAQAHRLASAIIDLQIYAGQVQASAHNLALTDLSGAPPSFDWVVDVVEQVPGVRFRELFARLPQTVPDGDSAIAAMWEMARQMQAHQASQQAVVADLPPAVLAALETRDDIAFHAALAQLPEGEAQAVVHRLTEAGILTPSA